MDKVRFGAIDTKSPSDLIKKRRASDAAPKKSKSRKLSSTLPFPLKQSESKKRKDKAIKLASTQECVPPLIEPSPVHSPVHSDTSTPTDSPNMSPRKKFPMVENQAYLRKYRNSRRCTADSYEQMKIAFSQQTWKSVTSLYSSAQGEALSGSNIELNLQSFPTWDDLPNGLDPQYGELLEGQRFVSQSNTKSEVLIVDSVGFEAEVRKWIKKTSAITLETLQENLQSPSEFTRFTTKSKTRMISMQLSASSPEIIVSSTLSKSGKITRIPFSQVQEIRVGPKTKGFESWRNQVIEDNLAFTIVYGNDRHLNLMSKYPHKVQLWLGGLITIIPLYKGGNKEFAYLSECWRKFGKKTLTVKEISSILDKMKIKVQKKKVNEILDQQRLAILHETKVPHGTYVLEHFIGLIHALRISSEIIRIFNSLSEGKDLLGDEKTQKFLKEEQKQSYTRLEIHKLLLPFKDHHEDQYLTLQGFSKFLSSDYGNVFNPYMKEIYQNMDRPLTDYFIYSSHNTYLEGNQLSGWSSSDMYMRVLKAGCRCVELDCWNGDNGEPIIFHGHTLTTRILFEDAIRAIRDYAFVSSDFPVILSLENHCNVEQQTRMAEIMLQYLKDNIARPIVGSDRKYLPSPNELKGKILIKGKVDKYVKFFFYIFTKM